MPGSNLKINLPGIHNRHNDLINRDLPFQHILEAIYRREDGKDLSTVLRELEQKERAVQYELITIETEGQQVIKLTKFQYNMARDVLFAQVQGVEVYEGSDKDFVKTAGDEIKFNYGLKKGYEVLIVIAGTISNESFGDDIYNSLNQFRQLVDTPNSYYGSAGKYVMVNEAETGLVYNSVNASTDLIKIEYLSSQLLNGEIFEGWIQFVNKGLIKGIKATPIVAGYTGPFTLSIFTGVGGRYIYHSGNIETILWDIMDIPHIDESGQDSVYLKLVNNGIASNFRIQIYAIL